MLGSSNSSSVWVCRRETHTTGGLSSCQLRSYLFSVDILQFCSVLCFAGGQGGGGVCSLSFNHTISGCRARREEQGGRTWSSALSSNLLSSSLISPSSPLPLPLPPNPLPSAPSPLQVPHRPSVGVKSFPGFFFGCWFLFSLCIRII